MVRLIWVCLALGALYGWLVGNWFARVIVFITISPICGLFCLICLAILRTSAMDDWGSPAAVIGWCGGGILAWWISSIPQRVLARREAITISPPIRPLTSQEVAEYAAIQKMPPNRHW